MAQSHFISIMKIAPGYISAYPSTNRLLEVAYRPHQGVSQWCIPYFEVKYLTSDIGFGLVNLDDFREWTDLLHDEKSGSHLLMGRAKTDIFRVVRPVYSLCTESQYPGVQDVARNLVDKLLELIDITSLDIYINKMRGIIAALEDLKDNFEELIDEDCIEIAIECISDQLSSISICRK